MVSGLGVASLRRVVGLWLALLPVVAVAGPADIWRELEPGLEIGHFDSRRQIPSAQGDLTVLRVDPVCFELQLLTSGRSSDAPLRNVARWCRDFSLLAAINAGMFQADHRTHVGFYQVDGLVVNGFANDYLSVAAFGPLAPEDPPFRIYDLDVTPLEDVRRRYRNVVQNLRLIKRPGENRWQPADDQWREAALAEDGQGRALLVYCRTAWSMHAFNEILLKLPLDVVAAQHLEGRSQARIWVDHPAYEEGPEAFAPGPALPNVLGVARRP
jgi:hypothetical protein